MPASTPQTELKFAGDIVRDDVFELAGLLYQVVGTTTNSFDAAVLNLSLIATQKPYDKAPGTDATLIIPKTVMFDIHID